MLLAVAAATVPPLQATSLPTVRLPPATSVRLTTAAKTGEVPSAYEALGMSGHDPVPVGGPDRKLVWRPALSGHTFQAAGARVA